MEKECVVCKKIFITGYPWAKTCKNIECKKVYVFDCRKIGMRKYYLKNKEKIDKYRKQWYLDNKDTKDFKQKRFTYKKMYEQSNKEYLRNRRKKYYYNNINIRLKELIRNRIRIALKHTHKHSKTVELLGCSIEQAREHLQKQFQLGMSWNNYNIKGWHIDHIVPCSSFDLTKEEEQRRCFHYTNLQPLWAHENLVKHTKMILVTI